MMVNLFSFVFLLVQIASLVNNNDLRRYGMYVFVYISCEMTFFENAKMWKLKS